MPDPHEVAARELDYHEQLYSGFAQQHFARPAVVRFREDIVRNILAATGTRPSTRVLSLGCGIGDTELLLAPHAAEVSGIDLSPKAIAQARSDAAARGIANARFHMSSWQAFSPEQRFDLVMAVFFLHHLPDAELDALPARALALLKPGGLFYALEPNAYRLTGWIGNLLVPGLMKKYETPDERPLEPAATAARFAASGYEVRIGWHDFGSAAVAGLFPGWVAGYRLSRALDNALLRIPALRKLGGNFVLLARAPAG